MNILVLSPDTDEARFNDLDYATSLRRFGKHPVLHLDPDRIYRAKGLRGLQCEINEHIDKHKIDVLMYGLGFEFDFDPRFLASLNGVFRVLLLGDDEHYFESVHRYYAQAFHLVLTTNPDCSRYRSYGTEAIFVPGVFDTHIFNPGHRPSKAYDVTFVGAMKGKVGRESYAKALVEAGINLQLFGAGTPAGIVSQQQVVDIYRRSRINLNFTGGSITTPLEVRPAANAAVRQVKGRPMKIALCGSFLLSEHAPGIEAVFRVGDEIDTFQNATELIEKVRFYVDNEARREEMAARSHGRAVKEYDEARFWPWLIIEVEQRANLCRDARSSIPKLDGAFWRGFGAWRFRYLVIFLFSAHARRFLEELGLLLKVHTFKPSVAVRFAGLGLVKAQEVSLMAAWLAKGVRRISSLLKKVSDAPKDQK